MMTFAAMILNWNGLVLYEKNKPELFLFQKRLMLHMHMVLAVKWKTNNNIRLDHFQQCNEKHRRNEGNIDDSNT
jgi:hypothetical protein